MKLPVVNANKSTLMNLNGLQNCVQINTKDMSGIAIVIRMKLRNIVRKQITKSRSEIWLPILRQFLVIYLCHIRSFITLASVKLYCLIALIGHIAQLLLIRKFYCFCPGPYISFKYVRHDHFHCPLMGEVSPETICYAD